MGYWELPYRKDFDQTRVTKKEKIKDQRTALGARIWFDPDTGGTGYQFMPIKIGGVQLWYPSLRLSARKTIEDTPMVELDGSVKEIINIDDYVIQIRGVIKRKDGLWPDDEMAQLRDMWKRKEAIPILNAVTAHFLDGNEYVVITNLTLPEANGFVESIRYEMECVSDIPFELELE